MLCSKTLTVNGHPQTWSDIDTFYIFQHLFFLININLLGPICLSHVEIRLLVLGHLINKKFLKLTYLSDVHDVTFHLVY